MADQALVLRKTGFVVDSDGTARIQAVPAVQKPRVALSREDRIDAYRAGIRRASNALGAMGFKIQYTSEHTTAMEFRDYLLDFRIQRPELVAHVGGSVRAGAKQGGHGGSLYKLSDEIKSEFCVQMIFSHKHTAQPIYVDLDESLEDPAQHIYDAIMGFLASLNEQGHKLGKATVGKKPKLAPGGPKPLPDWIDI